jgi:hypothetical protein
VNNDFMICYSDIFCSMTIKASAVTLGLRLLCSQFSAVLLLTSMGGFWVRFLGGTFLIH